MTCDRFQTRGLLFLSGELNSLERILYRKHLRKCPDCLEQLSQASATWKMFDLLSIAAPDRTSAERILHAAWNPGLKRPVSQNIILLKTSRRIERSVVWGLAVASSLILAFLIWKPIHFKKGLEAYSEWNDLFYADVDWIQNELERIDSGSLLTNFYQSGDPQRLQQMTDGISSMSEDFTQIRGDMDEIEKLLEGI